MSENELEDWELAEVLIPIHPSERLRKAAKIIGLDWDRHVEEVASRTFCPKKYLAPRWFVETVTQGDTLMERRKTSPRSSRVRRWMPGDKGYPG
jgi:hypothetical protein